jgi:type II secretory pathway pseudopilin PulG
VLQERQGDEHTMRRKILVATILVAVALGAYMFTGGVERNATDEKQDTQSIKQLVDNYSSGNIKAQTASITSKQLIVNEGEADSLTYDLPENEFFVSIAPYVDKTHPCATHSLTGCQGEMTEEEFSVSIDDMEGNEIIDKTLKSQSNGFIDLWLPRDKKYRITVEHNGKIAESEISTFESDDTCISTMQLI